MLIIPMVITLMPEGDDKAFMDTLYRNHHRLMLFVAWKYVRDKAAVEDITSESCVVLMERILKLKELECNALKAYIVSVVRSTAINYIKHENSMAQRWEKMIDEAIPVAASEVEKRIVLEEDLRNTHVAIDLLPEKERMALQMKVTMDMNYKDIAQAVGISETSVHKYITRAREKIRKSVYPEE